MTTPEGMERPAGTRATECARIPSTAASVRAHDGSWEACWDETDGRGGYRRRFKDGFQTQTAALVHAKRVEMAERLNRC